jgi:hypothetical protein
MKKKILIIMTILAMVLFAGFYLRTQKPLINEITPKNLIKHLVHLGKSTVES